MLTKPISDITKEDIEQLVTDKVRELRTLEYKATTPGNSDEEKKEFLADVSSFANAAGGHLLYGITAERDADGKCTGAAEQALGIALASTSDAEVLRLDNVLRDGLDPRVPGLTVRPIDGFPNGPVIVVHVPRSFAAPHMVKFKGGSRFFSRNSAGKYQLDVGEIRAAFAASEAVPQTIRRFREERLGRILSGDTPVPLEEDAPKFVMHLYPLSATRADATVELARTPELEALLWPPNRPGYSVRFNIDGLLSFGANPPCRGYVQVFRNGSLEAVSTRTAHAAVAAEHVRAQIPSPACENTMADVLTLYLRAFAMLGIEPPLSLMVSFVGVKGCRMATDGWYYAADIYPIERDVLVLPDIVLDDFDSDPRIVLRPLYDMLWQASGISRCPYYDADGNWKYKQ